MSKKLTTSTNDVLDTLALDDSIVEIDASKTSSLTIDDNIKVQKYAIYQRTAVSDRFTLHFTTPIIYVTNDTSLIAGSYTGLGVLPSETYIELVFGSYGLSVVYCFGVVFIQVIEMDV